MENNIEAMTPEQFKKHLLGKVNRGEVKFDLNAPDFRGKIIKKVIDEIVDEWLKRKVN
jgi:hypothetical protein